MSSAGEAKPPLWLHQDDELTWYWDARARAWLWSMRTGKSRAAIELAVKLWTAGRIEAVVILAPNNVHANWTLRQLPEWGGGLFRSVAWEHQERDTEWFRTALHRVTDERASACYIDCLAVNSEALQFSEARVAIGKFIKGRKYLLIVDESDDYGAPGAKRTRAANTIAKHAAFVRILTGTVVDDSPLKAYSQFELLEKGALGFTTAEAFNNHHAVYAPKRGKGGKTYQSIEEYRNLEELKERMARWSSVVLRSDCHDMPELLNVPRSYRPSREQLDAYKDMAERLSVQVDEDTVVTALEAAVRLIKFQQILGGYLIDLEGGVHDIPGRNPRLDLLSTEVALDPGKLIVWCRFQEDVRRVSARLREDGHEVVQYVGGMGSKAKNLSVDRFQKDRRVKAFVGTPVLGLELAAADTVVWYSHTFWNRMRRQADERGTKMGGTATTVVDFVAQVGDLEGVDGYILANQSGKNDVSEDLSRGGLKAVLNRVKL